MAENGLSERVERIENKLDALSESVDQRFKEVEKQVIDARSRPASVTPRRARPSKHRR